MALGFHVAAAVGRLAVNSTALEGILFTCSASLVAASKVVTTTASTRGKEKRPSPPSSIVLFGF